MQMETFTKEIGLRIKLTVKVSFQILMELNILGTGIMTFNTAMVKSHGTMEKPSTKENFIKAKKMVRADLNGKMGAITREIS